MICDHGNEPALCFENGCLYKQTTMKFLIKQMGANSWYFVLLDGNENAAFVSPVRYNSAAEAQAVVAKLAATTPSTPVVITRMAPFDKSREAI